MPDLFLVGKSIPRVDALEKASGKALFIDDLNLPGLLYGYTIRSTRQRAEIVRFTPPALPPAVTLVTAADIPGENYIALFNKDQPLLADKVVNYIGEPIALLAGPALDELQELARQFVIEYRDLPAIDNIDDSLSGELPPIFGQDNIFKSYAYIKGDPAKAFNESEIIIAGEYRTGYQEHAYLETQGMLALPWADGVKIIGSMQCPFYIQKGVAPALALPVEKIVVEQAVTGGAFGGKEEFPSLLAGHVALLALKTGRPVKIIYDRREDILCTTKRHPSRTRHRIGFDRDRRLTALQVDIVLDGGAHSTLSQVVLARCALSAPGVYRWAHIDLRTRAVATNQVPTGAFRGFGAPQAFFAIEQQMNHAAYRLGVDPYHLRKLNLLRQGDVTATGQILKESVGLERALDLVVERTNFVPKYWQYQRQDRTGAKVQGIGLAAFFHGCGFTGKGEELIKATVTVDYHPAQGAVLRIATVDMGQGMATVMRQICAETLHIPIERVLLLTPNTSEVPNSGPTVASRTTLIVGGLIYQCCRDLKKQIGLAEDSREFAAVAAARLEAEAKLSVTRHYRVPPDVVWDEERFVGDAYPIYSWAAAVVEVEVDLLTYEVTTTHLTAAHEIGKAINPILVEGQIEGGSLQGLGYASLENLVTTAGKLQQTSLTDYLIPTIMDTPQIEPLILEEPYSRGPYGAKGVGELPFIGIAPAFIGAVENALGVEFYAIPLTPEKILERLQEVEYSKKNKSSDNN
jgi:CO/xanthine dehydrogenase Mo-binding subunit